MYGYDAVDRSTLSRWARRLSGESGHTSILDSGTRRHTAQIPDNVQRVKDMVLEDRRVTVKEMSVPLGIGESRGVIIF
jgi:hypothetical protein